jgi:hypothetical protein
MTTPTPEGQTPSDTPRTDEAQQRLNKTLCGDDRSPPHNVYVFAEDMAQLERELNAAKAQAAPAGSPADGKVALLVEMPTDLNPLTRKLVKDFASALSWKLHAAEKKYGYSDGWLSKDWIDDGQCAKRLRDHVEKGDPRDVAAYCAFLWYHAASTKLAQSAPSADLAALARETARKTLVSLQSRWDIKSKVLPRPFLHDEIETLSLIVLTALNSAVAKEREELRLCQHGYDYLQKDVASLRAENDRLKEELKHARSDGALVALAAYKADLITLRASLANSGAVEALERTKEFLEECEVAEDRSNLDGDNAETVLQQINDGAEEGLKQVKSALANLQAILAEQTTEGKTP